MRSFVSKSGVDHGGGALLRIKMYPAGNGDAFLIRAAGTNVLVDGGYAHTFDNYIFRDLQQLANEGERLDLLVASHIDADHISGLIRLLAINGPSASPLIVPIDNIWHNSLRSLTAHGETRISPADKNILEAIRRRGHPASAGNIVRGASEISARQGSSFASMIHGGGYIWNGKDGKVPVVRDDGQMVQLPAGTIRLLGPTRQHLEELLKWWTQQLRRMGYRGPTETGTEIDDAFEFTCEHGGQETMPRPVALSAGHYIRLEEAYKQDISVTNRSSITTIVDLGGARILMLGDAWAEDVVESLRILQSDGHSMMFDAIKISHHGSLHNTSPELLEVVDAPRYFLSSNGIGHDHPDIEVLAAIVDRPAPFSRTLYFNYSTRASGLVSAHISESGTPFSVIDNATDWIEIEGATS